MDSRAPSTIAESRCLVVGAASGIGRATAAREMGGLDAVVNCAGILGPVAPAAATSVEDFEHIMKINLTGAFIVSQAVLPRMAKAGYGRLLHISSTAGKEGVVNMPAYSASKAGIMGMVKSLAKEFALSGVTVNAIAPGNVVTPLFAEVPKEQQAAQAAKIPMGRFGTPAEAAALIEFIVLPEASYTTGSVFDLSGGRATY